MSFNALQILTKFEVLSQPEETPSNVGNEQDSAYIPVHQELL
jgi:hypothetical protein